MTGASTIENQLSKALRPFVSAFAVLVALIYGTGFLCVYTFMERFGLRDCAADLFRGKYILVGILFMFFPVSIMCPWILAFCMRRIQTKMGLASNDLVRIPLSSYFLFFNLGLVFYIYVLFLPLSRAHMLQTEICAPIIIVASMWGPRAIGWFTRTQIITHLQEGWSRALRWTLVIVVVVVLDFFAFWGFFGRLGIIFWGDRLLPTGAIYYFLFTGLIPYTLWNSNKTCHEFRKKDPENERCVKEHRINTVCLCLMFYFLSTLAFGLKVYPYIPSAKGGGSFVESPTVAFRFRMTPTNVFGTDPEMTSSNVFIILEQTPNSFFVARKDDAGGPLKWQNMRNLPNIISLNRDDVSKVVSYQPSRKPTD